VRLAEREREISLSGINAASAVARRACRGGCLQRVLDQPTPASFHGPWPRLDASQAFVSSSPARTAAVLGL
jgi:hypothetical protein